MADSPEVRAAVLDKAKSLVNGDRNQSYGDPSEDYARTVAYWNNHLASVMRRKMRAGDWGEMPEDDIEWFHTMLLEALDAGDAMLMMAMVKLSRLANTPDHVDSVVDTCGYMACYAGSELDIDNIN